MDNQRDLFYYIFQNDGRYEEISEMIKKHSNYNKDIMNDEQLAFTMKLYIQLLYRISFLEYIGYSDDEILEMINLNKDVQLFTKDNYLNIKIEYRDVLDKYREIFENVYKSVTTKEVKLENKDLGKKILKIMKKHEILE